MGLIVPKETKKYFWNARTGKKPPAGYGTQESNPKFNTNLAFKYFKIPLKFSLNFINNFPDYQSFFKYFRNFDYSKDVLACFDYGTLFNTPYHRGHVCLVDRIYLKEGKIRLIDPGVNVPKWRVVGMKKLFNVMKFHEDKKSGGFWEITLLKS